MGLRASYMLWPDAPPKGYIWDKYKYSVIWEIAIQKCFYMYGEICMACDAVIIGGLGRLWVFLFIVFYLFLITPS